MNKYVKKKVLKCRRIQGHMLYLALLECGHTVHVSPKQKNNESLICSTCTNKKEK